MIHEEHGQEMTPESTGEMPFWPPPDWYRLPIDGTRETPEGSADRRDLSSDGLEYE